MGGDTNDHLKLPKDLLIAIFLRSSVESLICTKCVCKQWYELIQSPQFKFNKIQFNKSHEKGRLLLLYWEYETKNIALFEDETLVSDTYHDGFQLPTSHPLLIEGPINGLYCLYNYNRIVLWNPVLMELRAIMVSYLHFFPDFHSYSSEFGFGVDPSTNHYKLIFIHDFSSYSDWYTREYISVYNLTTNTGKLLYDLGDTPMFYDLGSNNVPNSPFLDGVYYWWNGCKVIGFDMGEETFRELMGPNTCRSSSLTGHLTMYNDKVALVFPETLSADVWVMLEENVWNKQFSLTSLPDNFYNVDLWKNNGCFFTIGSEEAFEGKYFPIVLCNANDHGMRNVGPIAITLGFRASIYYESLESVDCGTEHKQKRTSLETLPRFFEEYSIPYLHM